MHLPGRRLLWIMVCSVQSKASQVSPNARRRTQCKGGGGTKKTVLNTPKTAQPIPASARQRGSNIYVEQKSRKQGGRAFIGPYFLNNFPTIKAFDLQNISNLVSQACCGRPRGGYIGSGCQASAPLAERSAGKFANVRSEIPSTLVQNDFCCQNVFFHSSAWPKPMLWF